MEGVLSYHDQCAERVSEALIQHFRYHQNVNVPNVDGIEPGSSMSQLIPGEVSGKKSSTRSPPTGDPASLDLNDSKDTLATTKPPMISTAADSAGNSAPKQMSPAPDYVLPNVRIAYLLISPLLGPVASLLTCFTKLGSAQAGSAEPSDSGADSVELSERPSFAIFGDKDTFTSSKRLYKWAQDLQSRPNSRFKYFQLPGAGHFWREEGADVALSKCVSAWIGQIDAGSLRPGLSEEHIRAA